MYYTLGQREGLGIGGVKGAPEEPWFVTGKDMERNILWVVQGHEHPALLSASLLARDLSWISVQAPHTHWVYAAKTRYRMPDAACGIEAVDEERCEIAFAAPQTSNPRADQDADLYLIDADGGHRRLVLEERGDETGPVWSADGRYLYYVSKVDGRLYRIQLK